MKLSHFFDIWLKPLFVSGPDFSTCSLHKPEKHYTLKKNWFVILQEFHKSVVSEAVAPFRRIFATKHRDRPHKSSEYVSCTRSTQFFSFNTLLFLF